LSTERILTMLEAEIDPALLRPEAVMAALERSRDLPQEFDFLDWWFEDDEEVAGLLDGKRRARAKRVALIRDTLLPKHMAKWAALFAWTALLLRHSEDDEPWFEFFVSAKEALAGRAAAEIPLLEHVATITVEAFTEMRRKR
jgi:hypothetical protein